jgi:hypothetical protein
LVNEINDKKQGAAGITAFAIVFARFADVHRSLIHRDFSGLTLTEASPLTADVR